MSASLQDDTGAFFPAMSLCVCVFVCVHLMCFHAAVRTLEEKLGPSQQPVLFHSDIFP